MPVLGSILLNAASPARNQGFDVVLVDTAGRMQDNAPLMTALAKLIAVNAPDLVLFVGEALVGNEAVDQLVRLCFLKDRGGKNPASIGFIGDLDSSSTTNAFLRSILSLRSSSTRPWLITPWPRRRGSSTGLSSPSSIPSMTR